MKGAPTHNGYLHKKGEVGIKTYKRRWFILLNNEILYYKEEKDYRAHLTREPLGRIPLVAATVSDVHKKLSSIIADDGQGSTSAGSSSVSKSNHAHFRLDVPGRTYHLYAESIAEAEAWIKVIRQSKEHFSPLNSNGYVNTNVPDPTHAVRTPDAPVESPRRAEQIKPEVPVSNSAATEETPLNLQGLRSSPPDRLAPIALPGMGGSELPVLLTRSDRDERSKTMIARNFTGFTSPTRTTDIYRTLPSRSQTALEAQAQLQAQSSSSRPTSPPKMLPTVPANSSAAVNVNTATNNNSNVTANSPPKGSSSSSNSRPMSPTKGPQSQKNSKPNYMRSQVCSV